MFSGQRTRRADGPGVMPRGAEAGDPREEAAGALAATATTEGDRNGPDEAEAGAVMSRRDVYDRPMVAGRPVSDTSPQRLIYSLRRRVSTELERREEELDTRLRASSA